MCDRAEWATAVGMGVRGKSCSWRGAGQPRDLHTVLAKIEREWGAMEQHSKDRVELARCKEERVKPEVKERQQRKVLIGLYVKHVTGLTEKHEKLVERVDDKEAKGERMFSSGRGVETESGKDVREAVQLGVEPMKWG